MKFCLIVVACLLAACATHQASETSSPAAQTGSSQTTSVKSTSGLRPYESAVWDNGLQVIFIEGHHLPSISFSLLVKSGSASDPMTKAGLMNLVSSVMVRGTTTRSAEQIADTLGQLGSQIEEDVSSDYSWFQLSGLSMYQTKLWDVFSDIIMHPRFDKRELERQRKLVIATMDQRFDNPESFADLAYGAYLFGGHPYGRPVYGLKSDVQGIEQKDLFRDYSLRIRPNNSILIVTGDFNAELKKQIAQVFQSWSRGDVPQTIFPKVSAISGTNIRLVDKADLTQSQILIGEMGIQRRDPDYLPLRIASIILGGDFSSRLMAQVRVKLGLTYEISSSFDARLDRGSFSISTFTKNQTVSQTVEETLKVLKEFQHDGVSSTEVDSAKNYLMGAFPRVVETPEKLGFNLAILRLYGIPDSYLLDFEKNISKISKSEVNNAIRRHLHPDNLKILVLSNAKEATPQLRPLGLLEIKEASELF